MVNQILPISCLVTEGQLKAKHNTKNYPAQPPQLPHQSPHSTPICSNFNQSSAFSFAFCSAAALAFASNSALLSALLFSLLYLAILTKKASCSLDNSSTGIGSGCESGGSDIQKQIAMDLFGFQIFATNTYED